MYADDYDIHYTDFCKKSNKKETRPPTYTNVKKTRDTHSHKPPKPPEPPPAPKGNFLSGILGGIGKEEILLCVLIFLLLQEQADIEVILVLVFVLLSDKKHTSCHNDI